MDSLPTLVAHRGWNRREPENTLPAINAALAAGAGWLELDVQLSADRSPVLFHDRTLERCTGRPGAVSDLTLPELVMLPTGPAGARRADATVPTLDAVVDLLARWPAAQLFVELKRVSMEAFGREAMLDAALPALEPLRERVTLISFDAEVLRLARALGWTALGWILETVDAFALAAAQALDVPLLVADRERFTGTHAVLPAGSWDWMIFAVDTAEEALAWGARGARFVETDDIGALLAHPSFVASRA
jgi:glycerophosphoryl diester phosphodiesterase